MAHIKIKTSDRAYSSFFTTDSYLSKLIKTYLETGKTNSNSVVAIVVEQEFKINGIFNKIFD